MDIQVYTYLHIPYASVPQISLNWIRQLIKAGHNVRVQDYSGQNCRFADIIPHIGNHEMINDKRSSAPVGIYFGYPSYMMVTGLVANYHHNPVGVFVTEAGLSDEQHDFLKQVRWGRVCVPSKHCGFYYKQSVNPQDRLAVIHHGLHPEFYKDLKNVKKFEKFTYLFIFNSSFTGGTLLRKNMDGLLKAFSRVHQEFPDAELLIKTSSNIEADTPALEKENPGLRFELRSHEPDELVQLYRRCHVYVNPSRAEGFGMTVLEALAAGLPVISPIHSGLAEFLTEKNCYVVPSELGKKKFKFATNNGMLWDIRPHELAERMIAAHREYDSVSKVFEDNSAEVLKTYSWEEVLKPFMQWLETLQ